MVATNIASMDDYTLLRVLKLIPLVQLLPIRLVCTKWRSMIEAEITAKRSSLQLFRSSASRNNYRAMVPEDSIEHRWYARGYDCLVISKLNRSECGRFLVRVFPRVEKLFLEFHPTFCDTYVLLIAQWRASTHTLTLYFPASLQTYGNQMFGLRMLWRCLQSCGAPSLLHTMAITSVANAIELPTSLGHIESVRCLALFLFGDEQTEPLLHQLIGPNCVELIVEGATLNGAMLKYLLKHKSSLRKRLTSLALKCFDSEGDEFGSGDEVLALLASNCKALSHLDIVLKDKLHMEDISSEIQKLQHLSRLTLRSFNKFILSDIEPYGDNHDLAMPSIIELSLYLRIKLDKLKLLSILFPSVREITIDFTWVTCRCVSRQMERNAEAGTNLVCAQCYHSLVQHWNETMATMPNVTCQKLRFTNFDEIQ